MRTKQLTINKLALGNLKQRRKQYTILIIGIILAMVFSSGTLFFLFSSYETGMAQKYKDNGYQDGIISIAENCEEIIQKAYDDGIVVDYGFAHIIGYGYTEDDGEIMGSAIAWLDDNAKRLSNQLFLEGGYPENENEIALEKNALLRLGIDAKLGDEITLQVKTQNGAEYLDTVEKTYTLVGIVGDKRSHIQWDYNNSDMLPAAFVAQGTQTELGGKELLSAYVIGTEDYEEKVPFEDYFYYNDPFTNIGLYLQDSSIEYHGLATTVYKGWGYSSIRSITSGGQYVVVIVIVLVFASCMAIINSFNTNLKERKKQIGLLRAVGATRRQIISIFGRETFFISLICTPISIALSYGIVRFLISLLNEEAVFTNSLWVLLLCAAVDIVVTLLAALIPLIFASRITPMQAIRNIDINRKMKTKKIKTQKQFSVPAHLAKRSAKLYKGGKIAVSIILSVTIVFACFGFSVLNDILEDPGHYAEDYSIQGMGSVFSGYTNGNLMNGLSEVEKRDIETYPYFSKVVTHKEVATMFEVDEITDYFLCLEKPRNIFENWEGYWDSPVEAIEYFKEKFIDVNNEWYLEYKEIFSPNKDILATQIHSYDNYVIKALEKDLTAGRIDYEKLSSGEEVILIAPQTVKFVVYDYGEYFSHGSRCDNEPIGSNGTVIREGESPYSVGDKLKLSVVEYENVDDMEFNHQNYSKRTDSEVTIGAIVSPTVISQNHDMWLTFEDFAILTTHAGMSALCENARYTCVEMNVDENIQIDGDIDAEITAFLQPFADKYDGYFRSDYAKHQEDMNDFMQMYITLISIIILGFVICGSIVNNALTATIRERKKEIGTLRAVGADIRVLVGSYIRQLLSMFGYGYGIGFGISCVIFLVMAIVDKMKNTGAPKFSPWLTMLFCVILFAVCSINLWAKIRKEMKNSIVDNIREL